MKLCDSVGQLAVCSYGVRVVQGSNADRIILTTSVTTSRIK